jgi:hypothetical protein
MLFMAIERFRDNDMVPIYQSFAGERAFPTGWAGCDQNQVAVDVANAEERVGGRVPTPAV